MLGVLRKNLTFKFARIKKMLGFEINFIIDQPAINAQDPYSDE